jgi:hypothetical protein
MICAMRLDGSTACMTIEGATDTEVFQVFAQAIASALETITAQDGINWFASCGYSFL